MLKCQSARYTSCIVHHPCLIPSASAPLAGHACLWPHVSPCLAGCMAGWLAGWLQLMNESSEDGRVGFSRGQRLGTLSHMAPELFGKGECAKGSEGLGTARHSTPRPLPPPHTHSRMPQGACRRAHAACRRPALALALYGSCDGGASSRPVGCTCFHACLPACTHAPPPLLPLPAASCLRAAAAHAVQLLDAQVDVYAFGITMWEMYTGKQASMHDCYPGAVMCGSHACTHVCFVSGSMPHMRTMCQRAN